MIPPIRNHLILTGLGFKLNELSEEKRERELFFDGSLVPADVGNIGNEAADKLASKWLESGNRH